MPPRPPGPKPIRERAQTNTAGVSSKDRSASGPRPDGGGGALPSEETLGWVPVGGIIGYEGALADLPANWAFCDGTNGTPDMRNLCVIGANDESEIGDTGGSDTHQHNAGTLAVAAHTTAADTAVTGAGTRVTTANHTVSGATENTTILPPYYKLAWIKRLS